MEFVCNNISMAFHTSHGITTALDGVSFSVSEHEFVCLIGPSGCGKSTLLRLIAGLIEPTEGEITFSLPTNGMRLQSAMVFQDNGLFPWMTVLENMAFGLEAQGVARSEREERALTFIQKFGLGEFKDHFPHQISIGMRQRVATARAFLTDPQILLMDEPFGALDAQTRLVLQEELLRIWKEHQCTVVYVTHDIEEAVLLADRIVVMTGHPGHVAEIVPVNLARPRPLATRDLPAFKEITWHLWEKLSDEVRRNLQISG
jgi:NitT/TauT family transport system ATP-binding protein